MLEAVVGVALRAILASVLFGGVLAVLVLAATRYLALTAATRHALWTTALIATAAMPLAGVGVSVWKAVSNGAVSNGAPPLAARPPHVVRGPRAELATNVRLGHDAAALAPSPGVKTTGTTGTAARTAQMEPGAVTASAAATAAAGPSLGERLAGPLSRWTPRMSRNLAAGVVGIWLLGALIGMIGLAASIVRVRGLKRRSSPLDGALADELPWLTEAGPGREIYLRLSYETETPVAIGFRRPVILIPTELAGAGGLAAIEQLVMHEYAHLRRYDDWTNLVQRVIERVFWFNPVVWLVGRRIALEREIASDDAVVEKTGEAHEYATSLWRLAREMRMPEHAVVAPGALLTRKQITVRIEQLLDKKRARLHRSPAAALAVTLASVLAVGLVATSAPAVELPAEAPAAAAPAPEVQVTAWHRGAAPRQHAKAPSAHAAKPAAVAHVPAKTRTATVTVIERKTIRYEVTPPAGDERAARVPRVIHILAKGETPPPFPMAGKPHGLPAPPDAMPASPVVPPVPPVPAVPAVPPLPSLAPNVLLRLPTVRAALARAQQGRNVTISGTDLSRAMREAMAALPREIALEPGAHTKHVALDGVKLSRELIASCVGCSFRNADIRGVDLHGLKISANDFSGSDMRGVNLSGAQLVGVSLSRANLTGADLRNAHLSGVELRDAVFDHALLDGIRLVGVSIQHVSLHGVALRSVIANCTGCDFRGLDLHGQDLHGITLSGADLAQADLRDANLSGVRFTGVDLSSANLAGADFTNAQLSGCNLSGADLHGARTAGMTMHGSGLDG